MNATTSERRWAVILAGGDGRRCEEYWRRRYSDGRPKQFCSIDGERTLIEETMRRARLFAPPSHTIVDVCRKHLGWRHVWERAAEGDTVGLCAQPSNLDTGPAVLLATLMIERHCPGACVAVFPSDHFVADTLRFMSAVREAAIWTERQPDNVILLGAEATYPETEYGWLLPLDPTKSAANRPQLARLIEKPEARRAKDLFEAGALWNTSVFIFRSNVLLRMMEVFATEWWKTLDEIVASEDGADRFDGRLDEAYASLPAFNLSRDVLEHWPRNLRVLSVTGAGWCDLGNEERIRHLAERVSQLPRAPRSDPQPQFNQAFAPAEM